MQHPANSVLIQESDRRWLLFRNPVGILKAKTAADVPALLAEAEVALKNNLHIAGYLAYEAAPAFDPALQVHPPNHHPVAWFGLYADPLRLDEIPQPAGTAHADTWTPSLSRSDYHRAMERIFEYIHRGDTYQVNYTLRMRSRLHGDPYAYFHALAASQAARHAAYVQTAEFSVCSASPELFIARAGNRLVSRPMKGTAPRGRTYREDMDRADELKASPKNRAENVMIVDMIRNDLGRIATPGSVRVTQNCEVERYPTVLQMTSTVEAESGQPLTAILKALFPCASITGAPKVRTMQIIRELESGPRGIYTGSVGYAAPNGNMRFNVAIRTVTVDHDGGSAEYGVGGGIVWDSREQAEYDECLVKSRVLTTRRPPFDLLETMLWTPVDGVWLLAAHLKRLEESRRYFQFAVPRKPLRDLVASHVAGLSPTPHRLRLLLAADGTPRMESTPLTESGDDTVWTLGAARVQVDAQDAMLYHKTTHRRLYEEARASRPDCNEVVLLNQDGNVTETSIGNVAARIAGRWFTPPIDCGLLPGICRQHLIEQGELSERVITVDDLRRADEIVLLNSVRKRVRCRWVD